MNAEERGYLSLCISLINYYLDVDEIIISIKTSLKEIIMKLPPREKRVIRELYGLGEGDCKSQKEIAEELGLSSERVRQIKINAFKKMIWPVLFLLMKIFIKKDGLVVSCPHPEKFSN